MAPAPVNQVSNGKQIEEVSDDIDSVNDIKAKLKEKVLQGKSQFDSEKDKVHFSKLRRGVRGVNITSSLGCESNASPGCPRHQLYFTPRPPLPRLLLRAGVYLLLLLFLKAICAPGHFYAS